jgi:enoyl-CoA hydratase
MTDVVLVDVADRIAVVTLNRPEKRNALNGELQRALPRAVAELDADDGVDAIVVTGADPAFCAGVDLTELGSGARELVLPRHRGGEEADAGGGRGGGDAGTYARGPLPPHATPIIGAVNGVAVTGGLELALACDFLVASERARFADTHSRVGVMPGWGLTVLLPQAVGLRRAREMSATGNYVDADTALAWGLVNHVVTHDELLPFARALAADITSNDRAGVQRLLRTYDEVAATTGAEGWRIEAQVAREWAATTLDPAEVERRRRGITERGRAQQG